jgi:hypothetical protein
MVEPFPVTYRLDTELSDAPSYITYLCHYVALREKRKQTGDMVLEILPVYFPGPSRDVAEANAKAFWDDETAKAKASKERGEALGKRARKSST